MGPLALRIFGIVAIAALSATSVYANTESQTLLKQAEHDLYSLNVDRAIAVYRQAVAADANDARAHRGLATAVWLSIGMRRGTLTVDNYLGKTPRSNAPVAPPPPDLAAAFREAVDRAMTIARGRVAANPNDPEAHFQVGAAVGLRAAYVVTVEGSVFGAIRTAKEAFDEHEKVLDLAPSRADAGLIVGTYRYTVSVFSLPVRWMAYIAGFGGGKERGLQQVQAAAAFPGENQTEARLALVLLDNREGRYDEALTQLATLRAAYPQNRIFLLETAATELRAGRAAEAERLLNDGLARFAADARPKMFGETALWYQKRGMARAMLGRRAEAGTDLEKALASDGRKWVHGRTHLALGKLALDAGNRAVAKDHFQQAITLCESDNDPVTVTEARRLNK